MLLPNCIFTMIKDHFSIFYFIGTKFVEQVQNHSQTSLDSSLLTCSFWVKEGIVLRWAVWPMGLLFCKSNDEEELHIPCFVCTFGNIFIVLSETCILKSSLNVLCWLNLLNLFRFFLFFKTYLLYNYYDFVFHFRKIL